MACCSMSHCGVNRPFLGFWPETRKAGATMTRLSVARSRRPHSQRSGADDPSVALGDDAHLQTGASPYPAQEPCSI